MNITDVVVKELLQIWNRSTFAKVLVDIIGPDLWNTKLHKLSHNQDLHATLCLPDIPFCISAVNKITPSPTMPPSGKLDQTTLYLILSHSLHYVKTWRHPQNLARHVRCRQRRTESRPQVTCTENWVKFGHVVLGYVSGQTDRLTGILIADRNKSPTYRGQNKFKNNICNVKIYHFRCFKLLIFYCLLYLVKLYSCIKFSN